MAGSKKKAVVAPKKPKKKKEKKPPETLVEEEKIVTVTFGDHEYTGYVKADSLSRRFLEGAASKYVWQNGCRYEGPFLQSEIEGEGKYTWPDGSTYQGYLRNGKRHGYGVFTAADGITKYQGQWFEGKRHGKGRLIFDADGESFYDGDWCDGCKHGEGRQVWPSKNTYEGHWEEGRMHGFGTMTWFDNGMLEVYTGQWAHNVPQGQGKYTWHASGDATFGKEMPVQQTNNSFQGTWSQGLRSGYGTFQFANGAKYEGQWTDNVKHGEGRYTFEDGRIYAGEFISDNMATPCAQHHESTSSQALNLGGVDNPVRRCIEIADLAGFCMPNDRIITDPAELTGFNEPSDVFREIYNILLRHLGDLKKVYASMRNAIHRPGDDPWLVYMFHLWMLVRDVGILAPDCPLARVDRRIVCGLRQHGEAFPEDVGDLRPFTPRSLQNRVPGDAEQPKLSRRASKVGDEGLGTEAAAEDQDPLDEDEYEDEEEGDEEDEDAEEADADVDDGDADVEDKKSSRSRTSRTSRQSRTSKQSRTSRLSRTKSQGNVAGSRRPTIQSLGTRQLSSIGPIDFFFEQNKFWRLADAEAASRLIDVHSPNAPLMFRHFLEALVRMTQVAYPEKQGLESMLKGLLRERILPKVDDPLALESRGPFEFFADMNVMQVLDSFQTKLWEVFKDNAAGVGVYALPQWAQLLDIEEESGRSQPYRRTTARHFGGQQRRVHVQARMDVTIRVKDALSILFYSDLLSLGDIEHLKSHPSDSIFPDPREEDLPAFSGTPDTEERSSMKNTNPEFATEKDPKEAPSGPPGPAVDPRTPTPPDANIEGAASPSLVKDSAFQVEALEEFRQQSFKADWLEVVAILTEVFRPPSSKRIHWALDESSAAEELSLLDYLETELTFPEFQRLLLRIANIPAEKVTHTASLPSHACLDVFLNQVFIPAVESAPSKVPPEPEFRSETVEPVEPHQEQAKEEQEPGAAEGAEEEPEAKEAVKVATPRFWLGFCDPYHLDVAASATPRSWPEEYADQVLDW
ncbi:unnamed protein product [Durusdinium trenchii]|uniref:Uncharacterized protein n=1 Tax=Durusdinium trenchii TaxID=1381693 RepID=A0ABP0LYN9_9DINO